MSHLLSSFALVFLFTQIVSANDQIVNLTSDRSRDLNPVASYAEIKDLTRAENDFSFKLLASLSSKSDTNIVFSPYSIHQTLTMLTVGAQGNTQNELLETLGLTSPNYSQIYNKLDLSLKPKQENSFTFNSTNSIWFEKTFHVEKNFLDLLTINYGTGLFGVDFIFNPENSRLAINDWVANQTQNRITNLFGANSISNQTRMILTNAVYFKGSWATPFKQEQTSTEPFLTYQGSSKNIEMMHAKKLFLYADSKNWEAVRLPYSRSTISMIILLPHKDFNLSIDSISNEELQSITQSFSIKSVELSLPKFRIEPPAMSLANNLQEMGIHLAFSGQADFSKISRYEQLGLQQVIHKAFIQVDEEGTEAAAATAAVIGATSIGPTETVQFKVDHPFLFLIKDDATNALIFIGKVIEI